ncbi:MAG: SLBB domain-containing protein [Trichodesmium sp.]
MVAREQTSRGSKKKINIIQNNPLVHISLTKHLQILIVSMLLMPLFISGYQKYTIAQEIQTKTEDTYGQTLPRTANYILGVGDRISIQVFDAPELSGDYYILPNGSINLPFIGSIAVKFLTLQQVTEILIAKYRSILKRPVVTVNVLEPRPLKVGVTGEVNSPGSYTISLSSGVGNQPAVLYPTVIQAIKMAEGVTQTADLSQTKVLRPKTANEVEVIEVNLWKFLQEGDGSQDIKLQDGDMIVVPSNSTIDVVEIRQLALSGLAVDIETPRTVVVGGQVKTPGTYVVVGGDTNNDFSTLGLPTLTRAINLAGGITPEADIRDIQLSRVNQHGKTQTMNLNLWQLLQDGDVFQDIILQNGDYIHVPVVSEIKPTEISDLLKSNLSPQNIQVRVVGEVINPGQIDFPPNTTLNQAVMAAGGLRVGRARRGSVELIRLEPNGQVDRSRISLDYSQKIGPGNPLLRDNDIILVNPTNLTRISETLTSTLAGLDRIFVILNTAALIRTLGD